MPPVATIQYGSRLITWEAGHRKFTTTHIILKPLTQYVPKCLKIIMIVSHFTRPARIKLITCTDNCHVSCSAVYIREVGPVTKRDSHMFFSLPIDRSYLADRAGVQSIMPGTLINLLQRSLFPGVLFSLADIISHPENYPTITVATLSVPEFYDYSLTSYGFRVLGLLSEIQPDMERPPQKPSPECVFRREICAVHTDKDPVTQRFQDNWKSGWSIDLKKFFIILFIENSPAPSRSLFRSMTDHSSTSALKSGSNENATGSSDGRLGLFRKPLVSGTGNNTPSPLDEEMTKQLQNIGNGKSTSHPIYSPPQGLAQEDLHLATWANALDSATGSSFIQLAESSIPHRSQPSNYHLDLFNSPAQESFAPSLPPSFLNSVHSSKPNSPPYSNTSSPQPHFVDSPAWESFPPSLPTSFPNSVTSSPRPQSVDSSAASPVPGATDDQVRAAAILDICRNAGCSEEIIQQAKYKTGKDLGKGPDKGTLARILNHVAMVEVLTRMEYGTTATDPVQVKHYCHGSPLTGSQLVSAFGWSINSFKHKSSWFSWCEHAARNMCWNPQKSSEGKAGCPPCLSDPD